MSERKFCRACLKEIQHNTPCTNVMQPPKPPVHLRDNVKAKSYLECYYFCLKSNCNRFNITYLPEHSYICYPCMKQMLGTVEFITKSQKNEILLHSMYEDDDSEDEDDESSTTNITGRSTSRTTATTSQNDMEASTIKIISPTDLMEKYGEDVELQDARMCEMETYAGENSIEEFVIDQDTDDKTKHEVIIIEEVHPTTPIGVPDQKVYCKNDLSQTVNHHTSSNLLESRKTLRALFNCVLCKESFQYQRHLYQHYESKHDQGVFSFPCNTCHARFISQKALTFHHDCVHRNTEYVDCDICGQVILPTVYNAHRERHKTEIQYSSYRGGCG
ncbi:uncharacterized protein LOC142230194 [Haematobia irritans]|uniref:uncharacterized protein LOC142230194 n=1 Tax=Haematobia irritans TaxID=7368 RepID=UPI003F507B4A